MGDWATDGPRYAAAFQRIFDATLKVVPLSTMPEGRQGPWAVERFIAAEEALSWKLVRCVVKGERGYTPPGTYTRLAHDTRGIIMSDTLDELRDHHRFVRNAHGRILINGLGLGVCTAAILRKPEVRHVTVIEIDPDVISLVAPHLQNDRLTVINADALSWKPPPRERFDCVWHDIWDEIGADNLPQIHQLHRTYGHRATWQGSWAREVAEANR